LTNIYQSIPDQIDVCWHICLSQNNKNQIKNFDFDDNRVSIYIIDCDDSDIVKKRNHLFDKIKDGYFCLLDDDTIFLPELYNVYSEYKHLPFTGVILGSQSIGAYCIRDSIVPSKDYIINAMDTGMFFAHYSVLEYGLKWEKQIDKWSDRLFSLKK
jgi:hypothetical protein